MEMPVGWVLDKKFGWSGMYGESQRALMQANIYFSRAREKHLDSSWTVQSIHGFADTLAGITGFWGNLTNDPVGTSSSLYEMVPGWFNMLNQHPAYALGELGGFLLPVYSNAKARAKAPFEIQSDLSPRAVLKMQLWEGTKDLGKFFLGTYVAGVLAQNIFGDGAVGMAELPVGLGALGWLTRPPSAGLAKSDTYLAASPTFPLPRELILRMPA